jgi:hypothetical protein
VTKYLLLKHYRGAPAPGAGGKPIHEWLELRPFLTEPPTLAE